ncbi:MAG: DNA repair protein RecO [Oligoflexia bacterium]|nr:DNA repair protein RecO [Oligoflexia bacterium]
MSEIKSKGFILRTTKTKESDLVVVILNQKGEKVSAYARAALKSKKRFLGGLQRLSQIEYRLSEKLFGGLGILEETRLLKDFSNLSRSVEVLSLSSYLCELCEYCAHEGLENEQLYNLLGSALKNLNQGVNEHLVVVQFEVKLLSLMGWHTHFEKILAEEKNLITYLLTHKMEETKLTLEQVQKISGLVKFWVKEHIGEKHFKSLEVFLALRALQKQDVMPYPKNGSD